MTGNPSIYAQNNPLHPTAPMNTGGFGIYAQDEWAVLPRLKLTFALRAEHNFNPTCDINCFTLPTAPFSQIKLQGVDTPYNQALQTGRKDAFGSVDSDQPGSALWFYMVATEQRQNGGQRRVRDFLRCLPGVHH